MILIDQEGNKIFATIQKKFVPIFDKLIQEGCFYIISKFGVVANNPKFRLVDHPSKINFDSYTIVKKCEEFVFPGDGYDFVSYDDVNNGILASNVAFDVIGLLVDSKGVVIHNKGGENRPILEGTLENERGDKINFAMWDEFAIKLQSCIKTTKDTGVPIIIFIHRARLNFWKGQYQILNCFFGTRLVVNDESVPPILNFKNSLESTTGESSISDRTITLSSDTIFIHGQDYYTKFDIMKIDALMSIVKPTHCVVVAKLLKIQSENGWFYLACRECKKRVRRNENLICDGPDVKPQFLYNCDTHNGVNNVYPRIKLQVRVQDGTGSVSLVIFEDDICTIMNRTAAFLQSKCDMETDFQELPDDFKVLINKRYAFKITISKWNLDNNHHVYTVQKMSDDENIIKAVLKNGPQSEDTISNETNNMTSLLETSEGFIDSKEVVSVTADSESPIEIVSSTPSPSHGKKRVFDIEDSDVMFQSSTSKSVPMKQKLKIPKLEI